MSTDVTNDGASIQCENLVKIYSLDGVEIMALQGLDLAVQAGEVVGLMGASGSGKSTLLNVLGGLDRPTAGKVTVGGRELLKLSDAELDEYRRTQVGFVWQQATRNLLPYLTALENVELPLRLANRPPLERRERAVELLEVLGLSHRLQHRSPQLSGGEQQRVAIAVALANRPSILLADEPTGELDSASALDVYDALRKTNGRYGTTILIVSHDPNLGKHTNRVVAIRDGKTSTETVRSRPRTAVEPLQVSSQEGALDVEGGSPQAHPAHPAEFEELVVLDSAGRLQIPREYLETLNIGDRVRLEMKEKSISIHPVSGYERGAEQAGAPNAFEELYIEEDAAPEAAASGWFGRLRRLPVQAMLPLRLRRPGLKQKPEDQEARDE